ncbi:hypothetical protein [Macrococcoides canis]|uniref:hypothetical protein n=1 Tax=Macrococcoides canis TaxID=1855823 RepID=UPI00105EE611|nr:hypothetical protein [Macrococcus canis]TDM24300.1 hypothetical protein ETI02_00460 [Macrococcus canis]
MNFVHGLTQILVNPIHQSVVGMSNGIASSVHGVSIISRKSAIKSVDISTKIAVNIHKSSEDALKNDWLKIAKDNKRIGNDMRKAILNYGK